MTCFHPIIKQHLQFEKTKGTGDFATALLILSQRYSPDGFTKSNTLFCLCCERLSPFRDVTTWHRFGVWGRLRAAREARSFRQQRDAAQGPADPVTTWRVPLPDALKEAPVIDLGLQWVFQNTLVLTSLLEMRRAQPKPCKHLASMCLHMSWMPASKASYGHYPMKGWFAYLCHLGSEYCLYWPTADDKKNK